jgi:hypothetical protein
VPKKKKKRIWVFLFFKNNQICVFRSLLQLQYGNRMKRGNCAYTGKDRRWFPFTRKKYKTWLAHGGHG